MLYLLVGIGALVVGLVAGYVQQNRQVNHNLTNAHTQAKTIATDNQRQVADTVQQIRQKIEAEVADHQADVEQEIDEQVAENELRQDRIDFQAKSLQSFANRLDKTKQNLNRSQAELQDLQTTIATDQAQADQLQQERERVVHEKSGLAPEQAEQVVLQTTRTTLQQDYEMTVRDEHEEHQFTAPKEARQLMVDAIQAGPVDVPRAHIDRNVIIPDEGMRNKIVGKNEQRLRLLETLIGVDLIFNPESPETLIISTNDPLRREIARGVVNELITAKQVNTGVIENLVRSTERQVLERLRTTGEETCASLHLGWVHPDLMKLVGRLQYRTSYGQNVLQHSVEVAELCGMMATELGANVRLAKRAGLLHDIGKAVDREVNGTHVELGVQIAQTYGEDEAVVDAIAASHGDVDSEATIAVLVRVADSMSGARPGARSESVEEYLNRLKGLERIANSHPAVKDSYAIQAGRELRMMVDPTTINDQQTDQLAEQVCEQIESELTYPGKIKVTAIRRSNAVQYVGGKPQARKKHAS
ncbi:ribonuclease Y [Fructilactobacillus myrtifloralis]|uniref:Ribonuclease Y n=1 Tax=Fructilactobacillus myrtifloralis TaxID=2940301 RepID=A0ABY5BLD4_9LACO|nr:ribonuclease Y [Fructilactobacillus myrtifloralis]USS84479.1 ribonuclease Y [Fructilactobacillus myrtifloralis]